MSNIYSGETWPQSNLVSGQRLDFPVVVVTPETYDDKILGYNPVLFLKLTETSGSTADNAEGTAGLDGTYVGATLDSVASPISGDTAPLFDGVNDQVTINAAALDAVFNLAAGGVAGWFRVSGAGVWSDSSIDMGLEFGVDPNNRVRILKDSANDIRVQYKAGGAAKNISYTTTTTDWMHVAMTWSVADDEVILYINGVAQGVPATSLGTWSGTLASAYVGLAWNGYISRVALFATTPSAADILDMATV